MADEAVVHIGENSPEEVAFKLLKLVASVEKRDLHASPGNPADRQYILDTYAECITAVKQPHLRLPRK